MEDAAINSVGAGGGSLTFRGTGTPRWVVDPRTNTNADLGIEGYPNGDAVESLALSGWIIRWRGSATHPARIFPIDIV